MKQLYLIALTILISVPVLGQDTILNPSFEFWTNVGLFEDPQDWSTPNSLTVLAGKILVTKSTDAAHGNLSAKLKSDTIGAPAEAVVPGILTNGQIIVDVGNFTLDFGGGCNGVRYYITGIGSECSSLCN